MIDLDNPEHVKALRWACNQIRMRSVTLTADAVKLAALDALTAPNLAADLLRRLLERCGLMTKGVDVSADGERLMVRIPCSMGWYHMQVGVKDLLRIAPALLDATDRDAALAVLRGER